VITCIPILIYALSSADFVLDLLLISDLSTKGKIPYAILLAAFSIIPFCSGLVAKYYLHLRLRSDVIKTSCSCKSRGAFDLTDDKERINFVIAVSLIEIGHFLTEDATTIFIWWQSGIYLDDDSNEPHFLYFINMVFSLGHAAVAAVAVIVVFYQAAGIDILNDTEYVTTRIDLCREKAMLYMVTPVVFLAIICGWIVLSIFVIMEGISYNQGSLGSIGANKGIGALYTLGIFGAIVSGYVANRRITRAMLPKKDRKRKTSGAQIVHRNDIGMLESQYDAEIGSDDKHAWDEIGPFDPDAAEPSMVWG
jgi:hypothetical protein